MTRYSSTYQTALEAHFLPFHFIENVIPNVQMLISLNFISRVSFYKIVTLVFVLGVLFYSWTFVGFLLSWIIGGKGVWPHLLPPNKFTMQDGWYVDRKLVFLVVFRTHSLTTVASSQFTMVVNYVQTVHMYLPAWQPFFYWKTITKKWRKKVLYEIH
jgi:hypothetical protein